MWRRVGVLLVALCLVPGGASAATYDVYEPATLTATGAFFGSSGSRIPLGLDESRTYEVTIGDDVHMLHARRGGASFPYSCDQGESLAFNVGGAVPGVGLFGVPEPIAGDYGALVVVGGSLVGASGWSGFVSGYLDKQNVTARHASYVPVNGTAWTSSTSDASFNASGEDFRAVGVTQAWGGAVYPMDTPLYSSMLRREYVGVVTWVPSSTPGKVDVRRVVYSMYGGEAWGGVKAEAESVGLTKGATEWTPEISIGGWRWLFFKKWDESTQKSRGPERSEMPFVGRGWGQVSLYSGVTTDAVAVQALHDGATAYVSALTASTPVILDLEPYVESSEPSAAPFPDGVTEALGDAPWAVGLREWLSETLDGITGKLGGFLWFFDVFGDGGVE